MAKWTVRKIRPGVLILEYRNCGTGGSHVAGELKDDTPATTVIGWIATEGGPFVPGTVLALLPKLEAA